MMRCEEALRLWQEELLGLPVDPAELEAAYQHIGACETLCAETLGTTSASAAFTRSAQMPGRTDLYEALGLRDEEEGDTYAREWAHLMRAIEQGTASQEDADHLRVLALAAWESAAAYYQEGMSIRETAFLREGLARIKHKRLRPLPRPKVAAGGPRQPSPSVTGPLHPDDDFSTPSAQEARKPARGAAAPSSSRPALDTLSPGTLPLLELVAEAYQPGKITVRSAPAGWQISSAASRTRPATSQEGPVSSLPTGLDEESNLLQGLTQPHAQGMLGNFAVALWAARTLRGWRLEILIYAQSPQRPWSEPTLTLEDSQGRSEPAELIFARRAPQKVGWWARLRKLPNGSYQLRLAAQNPGGESPPDATLDLRLMTEQG